MLYGWEYGAYTHYTPTETSSFLAAAHARLEGADDFTAIAPYISALVSIAGYFAGCPAVGPITALILARIGLGVKQIAQKTWEAINYVNMFNAKDDPSFGFMLYQNFHWVVNPQWWDPQSYTQFCLIQSNGVVYHVWPTTGVCYMTANAVNSYVAFITWYNNHVGLGVGISSLAKAI